MDFFVWLRCGLAVTLCLGAVAKPSHGEDIRIPADLVQQLFDQQTPNAALAKRPFALAELVSVVRTYARTPETAADLTRRYLQISYAAGLVDLAEIGNADLPETAKLALFRAPIGSVRFTLGAEPLKLLEQLSPNLWQALPNIPGANLAPDQTQLEISKVLAINENRYSKLIFYATQVPMHTDAAYYLVSYPRRATHRLDTFLELGRSQQRTLTFTNVRCQAETCVSQSDGDSFASFSFLGSDAVYPQPGQRVEARCRYQTAYRREYESRLEMEFAFENCLLDKLDGQPPRRDPLLDELQRVKLP